MTLSEAKLGNSVVITGCDLPEESRERMFALGLVTGQKVSVIRRGIGGDPIQIRLGATELMLRRMVGNHIFVESLEAGTWGEDGWR